MEIIFEIADCEKVQASYQQSKRRSNGGIDLVEQLLFAGKAYLKINSRRCTNLWLLNAPGYELLRSPEKC